MKDGKLLPGSKGDYIIFCLLMWICCSLLYIMLLHTVNFAGILNFVFVCWPWS